MLVKPLRESKKLLPNTFEKLIIANYGDLKTQNSINSWFSRDSKNTSVNKQKGSVNLFGKNKPFYVGAFEATLSKGYLENKDCAEICFRGSGWLSVKLLESTVTKDGVATETKGGWKKLDTVRECEILSLSNKRVKTKNFKFRRFYNKPFNVSDKAFLKGFHKVNKNKIVSIEVTVRYGNFEFYSLEFK